MLQDTFQERIALKAIDIDREKLRIKFLALNVRFRWSKFRFSRFKETCARGHQRAVPPKSRDEMAADRLTVCEQKLL